MSYKKESWYSDRYFQIQTQQPGHQLSPASVSTLPGRGERGGASFMRSEIVHVSSTSLALQPSISMHPPYADRDENMQQPWSSVDQSVIPSKHLRVTPRKNMECP
ncbi:hypothetical protein OIU77_010029 [Salix suchowensis]|uniref:Uncharacterized protein n=1 Tax=Salix suchowensis TaxID=1278906 RepID=A0ABQ9A6W0_9ROSI|nr:hypothetical protein OIU78_015997 [Salix suchowensis]KAJ6328256.1 hypothetical protein OIU77_010029 [Salix suchowensis]